MACHTYYSWNLKQKTPVDSLFDGLEKVDEAEWPYLTATVMKYLSLSEEDQEAREPALRRYLISKAAHSAFSNKPTTAKVEDYPFEFWVIVRDHFEWNESKSLLQSLSTEYAFRYILEVAPELSKLQRYDDLAEIAKISGVNVPPELLNEILGSDKD